MEATIRRVLQNEDGLRALATRPFNEIDTDRSGHISKDELKIVLLNVSKAMKTNPPSDEQIEETMKEIDSNNDGTISFDEFVELLRLILTKYLEEIEREKRLASETAEERKAREEAEEAEKKQKDDIIRKQVAALEKYLQDTGLHMAFQVIYTEILQKKIDSQHAFAYTAMRLRQIGKEVHEFLPAHLRGDEES
jgi:hypothetical protein